MILHHVAQGAGGFVVTGTPFDAEGFGRGDLDVIDITRVPNRFKNRVGKTENQDVLRGFFPEKVINSIGLIFGKGVGYDLIQFLG